MGDHVAIRERSRIDAVGSIVIGSFVIISTNVRITDSNHHPTSVQSRRAMLRSGNAGPLWDWTNPDVSHAPVHIEDDVWIGDGALILKGVATGSGAIVAARAVVTHDVPSRTVAAGNPAQIVKSLDS
jgi:acetyltransferase-like isoleucine patch superfamily enzyme